MHQEKQQASDKVDFKAEMAPLLDAKFEVGPSCFPPSFIPYIPNLQTLKKDISSLLSAQLKNIPTAPRSPTSSSSLSVEPSAQTPRTSMMTEITVLIFHLFFI